MKLVKSVRSVQTSRNPRQTLLRANFFWWNIYTCVRIDRYLWLYCSKQIYLLLRYYLSNILLNGKTNDNYHLYRAGSIKFTMYSRPTFVKIYWNDGKKYWLSQKHLHSSSCKKLVMFTIHYKEQEIILRHSETFWNHSVLYTFF